jgi:hypothetical protein
MFVRYYLDFPIAFEYALAPGPSPGITSKSFRYPMAITR